MLESTSNQVLVAFRLEAVSFRDSKVFEGTTNSLRSSMSSWRFGGDYEKCMKPIKITSEFYIDQIRKTTKNHKDMISYDGMTRHDTEFRGRSTIYQALQKVYRMRCIGYGQTLQCISSSKRVSFPLYEREYKMIQPMSFSLRLLCCFAHPLQEGWWPCIAGRGSSKLQVDAPTMLAPRCREASPWSKWLDQGLRGQSRIRQNLAKSVLVLQTNSSHTEVPKLS